MQHQIVALFGEAGKGEFRTPHLLHSTGDLLEQLGEPVPESQGIPIAIQTLLYHHSILYFRVEEEGFSYGDYVKGLELLKAQRELSPSALFMPGVGDGNLIEIGTTVCAIHRSFLIITEADLYDYLTSE